MNERVDEFLFILFGQKIVYMLSNMDCASNTIKNIICRHFKVSRELKIVVVVKENKAKKKKKNNRKLHIANEEN